VKEMVQKAGLSSFERSGRSEQAEEKKKTEGKTIPPWGKGPGLTEDHAYLRFNRQSQTRGTDRIHGKVKP